MIIPEVRAVGTVAAGLGPVEPGLPAGTAEGDLLLMLGQTAAGSSPLTAAGWDLFEEVSGLTAPVLTVLTRTATGSDPHLTNDAGDHQLVRIFGIKAKTYVMPLGSVMANAQTVPTKTVEVEPGGVAVPLESLVVIATAASAPDATGTSEFSSYANESLTAITERIDNTTAEGLGGALGVATGVSASLEELGPTTATAATLAQRTSLVFYVLPAEKEEEKMKPVEGGEQRFPLSPCYPVRTP